MLPLAVSLPYLHAPAWQWMVTGMQCFQRRSGAHHFRVAMRGSMAVIELEALCALALTSEFGIHWRKSVGFQRNMGLPGDTWGAMLKHAVYNYCS
eukprot:14679749-Alexandrium_andersonii.AAC.1